MRSDEFRLGKVVEIRCENPEETFRVASSIHEQLKGNEDYINSDIILHYSDEEDKAMGEPNKVWLYVSNEVETMPDITLKLVNKEEEEDGKQEN